MVIAMLATFIPSLPVLAGFLVAGIILGLTPGPDMTYFLSRTVAQSRTAGFVALSGTSVGVAIHSVLVAAGLSALLAASVTAFTILKIAGALYLAYLAYDAIRHGSSLSLEQGGRRESYRAIFLKGLLIDLLNPKVIIFFVTFLPQFVSATDPYAARKMLFLGLFFMVINVPVCGAIILAAGRISGMLKQSSRGRRVVDWIFASVLGAFAVRLILAHGR